MPLAIQLFVKQEADEVNQHPVWTPNDLPNNWLLAKMFFNNASGQVILDSNYFRYTSG